VIYTTDVPQRRAVLQVVGRRVDISIHEEWGQRTPRTQIAAIGAAGSIDVNLLEDTFARLSAVPTPPGPHNFCDPWLRMDAETAMALPRAGQPGHGRTASLRRQPVRLTAGRMEGGYTGVFEVICPGCGDHPYLDYSEVSPRLQRIRGPYLLEAGLAAYAEHLGMIPAP
jgi:hypothetical protein